MNVLYFDCFSGISGDMILGALVDAGADFEKLKTELAKLNLSGYEITSYKKTVKGITGTKVDVKIEEDHHHRGLNKINQIIDDSFLDQNIKDKSKEIFLRLATVEAKIHNKEINEIHFHEVGAMDAIVDVVGSVICINLLGIEKAYSSKVHVGCGTVKCAHGIMPVPAPATLELLKGVPVYSTGIESELVTPTGASVLTAFAEDYGPMPEFIINNIGFGMGTKELPIANFLRVAVGKKKSEVVNDTIQMIETNIDDMNPQYYDHIITKLFEAGAKDVFLTPIIMKKNRPGIILSVMTNQSKLDELSEIIFNETTTLGIRISDLQKRKILAREIKEVDTSIGKVKIKIRNLPNGSSDFSIEYDDCKKIAAENNISINKVADIVKKEAEKFINEK